MVGAEQLLGAVAREVLHHIGVLAPAVIALAGVALGIFVREDRTGRFKHGLADEILRRDEFQSLMLASLFINDGVCDLGVDLRNGTGHGLLGVTWHDVLTVAQSTRGIWNDSEL